MKAKEILKRPVVTEKSLERGKRGEYTFVVERRANKTQIARAVEEVFGVEVAGVAVVAVRGKRRKRGKRRQGVIVGRGKKAIVKLAKGKIELFSEFVKKEEK